VSSKARPLGYLIYNHGVKSYKTISPDNVIVSASDMSALHSHEGGGHSHELPGGDHGHSHETLSGPGSYMGREMPIIEGRDWNERAFTVGIGG